jgi:hypothetical protein
MTLDASCDDPKTSTERTEHSSSLVTCSVSEGGPRHDSEQSSVR